MMNVRGIARSALLAAGLAALAQGATAQEAYVAYDNFPGSGPIDATKWSQFERQRKLVGGQLNLVQRDWGGTASDSGTVGVSFGEDIIAPGRITQLKALIRVNAAVPGSCAASASVGNARARLISTFFNTGNPIPGNFLGDVIVQARVSRSSNSTDPEGVLRVQGVASICTASDCNQTTPLGVGTVDLGTATVGQQVSLAIEWSKAGKKFVFRRDSAPAQEITYTVSDVAGPGRLLQSVGNRLDVPNCLSGPRASGFVDASFDGVSINRSGKL